VMARHTDSPVLDLPAVHAILAGPPATTGPHPASQRTRALCDCPDVPLSPAGPRVRLLVAPSPATADSPSVGERRAGMVSERFVSTLPAPAFSAKDVLDLSRHRGSFETVLSDEDEEQDADRWVSRTPFGQECFQTLAPWLWKLRLERGQHLAPTAVRTTECAPAHVGSPVALREPAASVISGPAQWATRSCTGGFPGSAFPLHPDGSLRCPADRPLSAYERRPEHDGSLPIVSAGRIGFCRRCSLREPCHEHPSTTTPRRVSAVVWPVPADPLATPPPPASPAIPLPASSPLFWREWPRRSLRRRVFPLMRRDTATFSWESASLQASLGEPEETIFTREQRAHSRLSWPLRLARNARPTDAPRLTVLLHGLPARFFETFGVPAQAAASRSCSPSRTASPIPIELDGSSSSKHLSVLAPLVLFFAGFFLPSFS
jgi:hypothetical protein